MRGAIRAAPHPIKEITGFCKTKQPPNSLRFQRRQFSKP